MDEFVSLTDEIDLERKVSAVEEELDCLFELCKEDFPFLSTEEQTINIGKFLNVSSALHYSVHQKFST